MIVIPINARPEYFKAEQDYQEAKTKSQKINALKKMLATAPTHKGAEKLRADIKKRVAKLKYKSEKEKKGSGSKSSISISKEGAVQIVFIGLPNSGKSTLLSKLSGKKIKIAGYEFTTKKPQVGAIPIGRTNLQGIEIPAIYKGFSKNKHGRQMLSLIRNADFIVVVCKKFSDIAEIQAELEKSNIYLRAEKKRVGFKQHFPHIVVTWEDFDDPNLIKRLWNAQRKIRIKTKVDGRVAKKPVVLKRGSTVEDVADHVHKDMVKKFRFARIWGKSAKFRGQQVGLDHVLEDEDIVEIFMK